MDIRERSSGSAVHVSVKDDVGDRILRSEQFYESLFRSMVEGMVVQNGDGQIVACNESAQRILGLTEDQLRGRTSIDPRWRTVREDGSALPGEEHPAMVALRTGKPCRGVVMGVHTPDSELRWITVNAEPLHDVGGEQLSVLSIFHDVTEQISAHRALAASQADYERFFDMSPGLVTVADFDGHFLRINPAFTRELGYSSEELMDRPFLDLIHPDDLADTVQEMAKLSQGETVRDYQNRYRHQHGHWVWLAWNARADGDRIYAMARNVTEEKRAHDELARRAHELELTNEELEQFAYVASHDLQEPLRTLTSYAELVTDSYAEVLDSDGREFLGYMTEAADRLRALIQALLRYSRLGSQAADLQEVSLGDVVEGVLKDLEVSVASAGARVVVEDLPTIVCDPVLLARVFQNLISNGIKFNQESTPVVTISAERTRLGWEVQVKDNGIGIDEEHREKVFEVFKRLHVRNAYPGTGMGLAICKRIVQQHGGTMWCTANPGGGSVLHFTLLGEGPHRDA